MPTRAAKAYAIAAIILCQVASMTLWFSASAPAAALLAAGDISGRQAGWLTAGVQIGFVAGTLLSASLGLPDRIDPRRVFATATLLGAVANAALLVTGFESLAAIGLRFLTGFFLAGVYPVGIKMAAGWAERAIGLMIGALVGALTLGSALPHAFNAFGGVDWRIAIAVASACAVASAGLILTISLGPKHRSSPAFRPALAMRQLRRPAILFANAGYLGHMWELYAMWAWIAVFLDWGLRQGGSDPSGQVGLLTFVVIGSGAIGCVGAGLLADRFGRTAIAIGAMAASGICASIIGVMPAMGTQWLLVVAIIWGITIVADSAQFSAAITELSAPDLVGTMLTVQTSLGFLLTVLTIQTMPLVVDLVSWRYAFAFLAIGPAIGCVAMLRLRRHPDATAMAQGRR